MRLIDADTLKGDMSKLPIMSNWGEAFMPTLIDEQPTIDPETLPIVRELRAELERVTKERDEARRDCAVAERNHERLFEARKQLKTAITDMEALMWYSGDGCEICEHKIIEQRHPYTKLGCKLNGECNPKWCGADMRGEKV